MISLSAITLTATCCLLLAWIQFLSRSELEETSKASSRKLEEQDIKITDIDKKSVDLHRKVENYQKYHMLLLDFCEAADVNSGAVIINRQNNIEILEGMTVRFEAVYLANTEIDLELGSPPGERKCNSSIFSMSKDLQLSWDDTARTIGKTYIFNGQIVHDDHKVAPKQKWKIRLIYVTCDRKK